jgi:Ran GTPase-activating protein (RanGAP) involved in mRNA processing and transport
MNTPTPTPDAGLVHAPPPEPYTVDFVRALHTVPAKDWAQTWPAEKTVLMRMASKSLRALLDEMQLPVVLRSNWHKIDDQPKPGRAEHTQCILKQLPVFAGLFLVKRLDLVDCGISERVASTLCGLLAQCPDLAHLDLSHNDMGPEGMDHLSDGLRLCTRLRILMLTSNSIGNVGTMYLATVLPYLGELTVLDLGHNNISGDTMDMFAPILVLCPKIKCLKLDNNLIGDNLEMLAKVIPYTNCMYVDLSYNHVGISGLVHILPLMCFHKFVTAGNPELENVVFIGTRQIMEVD